MFSCDGFLPLCCVLFSRKFERGSSREVSPGLAGSQRRFSGFQNSLINFDGDFLNAEWAQKTASPMVSDTEVFHSLGQISRQELGESFGAMGLREDSSPSPRSKSEKRSSEEASDVIGQKSVGQKKVLRGEEEGEVRRRPVTKSSSSRRARYRRGAPGEKKILTLPSWIVGTTISEGGGQYCARERRPIDVSDFGVSFS